MRFYNEPRDWLGPGSSGLAQSMTVLDLIKAGSLDTALVSLLWLLLERRISVIVAAQPRLAGKTTVLTALLDFVPPDSVVIVTRGWSETFDFVGRVEPSQGLLLCNEISDHLYVYHWGPIARRIFELKAQGFMIGSTMHAQSAGDALRQLHEELQIPAAQLDGLMVISLDMLWAGRGAKRWIDRVSFVTAAGQELETHTLAQRTAGGSSGKVSVATAEHLLQERWGNLRGGLARELEARAGYLEGLVCEGRLAEKSLREAALRYGEKPSATV